jgi:hypothetical protein
LWGVDWISKEFLIAACVSLLIALVAVSWSRPLIQGPPPQAKESTYGTAETNKKGDVFDYTRFSSYIQGAAGYCTSPRPNEQSEWSKKFICESKITDAVIAVLTFFLAVFTGLLVSVGNRQERTTRQQMRAFVYLDKGSIINVANPILTLPSYQPTGAEIGSPTEGPIAFLTITNSGSTPAYGVIHWAGIAVSDFPVCGALQPREHFASVPTSILPPNAINTKNVRMPHPLTQQESTD